MKRKELAGQEYPHFKVIKPVYKEYQEKNKLFWQCKCECGNLFLSTTNSITSQKIKSCGCYQKKYQKEKHLGRGKIKIGDRFGLLIVTDTSVGNDGRTQYVCKCDCGNAITLSGSHLVKRYSCGCLTSDSLPDSNVKVESFVHLGKKTVRNTSGCPGVTWKKDRQKWDARIYFDGEAHHLGYFDNKEDAVKARKEAENKIYAEYSEYIEKMPNKNNAFTKDGKVNDRSSENR